MPYSPSMLARQAIEANDLPLLSLLLSSSGHYDNKRAYQNRLKAQQHFPLQHIAWERFGLESICDALNKQGNTINLEQFKQDLNEATKEFKLTAIQEQVDRVDSMVIQGEEIYLKTPGNRLSLPLSENRKRIIAYTEDLFSQTIKNIFPKYKLTKTQLKDKVQSLNIIEKALSELASKEKQL
ncbi:MAG: hypothetical protein ACK4PR_10240, partial [Gammaproteobacteria bacterium]